VRLHDDDPESISRRLSRRDLDADADRFSLFLDPQHDHLTGVELRVTAAGVQKDAIIYNDMFSDVSRDAVWDSAVSVDAQGWCIEMRIPFSQLRFQRTEPMVWGINAQRIGRPPQATATGDFVDVPASTTILGAAKVTGRTQNGWTVGLLDAVTGREFADTTLGDLHQRPQVEPLTNYLVGRAHRELGSCAGVGLLMTATNRELPAQPITNLLVSHAVVAGVDAHYFLDRGRDWVVTGGVAGSQLSGSAAAIDRVQRNPVRFLQRAGETYTGYDPTRTSLTGWTGHVDVNKNTGNIVVNGSVWGTGPGFDANDLGFMNQADRAGGHAMVTWRKMTPDRYTRSRYVWVSKWYTWNWRPDLQGDGWQTKGQLEFLNYWKVNTQWTLARRVWDDRLTRGGPETIRPGGNTVLTNWSTDPRTPVSLTGYVNTARREFGGRTDAANVSVTFKPSPAIDLSIGPTVTKTRSPAQYVREVSDATATDTFGRRYVFADIKQTEVSMTTRLNWTLSPTLSLQLYAQPLLSVGDYKNYKELAQRRTFDFTRYGLDAGTIAPDPANPANGFVVDPDGAGPAAPFTLGAGDFNFKSLRMNTILRWQWHPGSTMYFVWTEQRQNTAYPGEFEFGRDTRAMFGAPADDVVMVKVSYWFGR
jgi:hypothetical protein